MTAEEKLLENGYEGVTIFKDFGYDSALIGISDNGRAIYDYEKMILYLGETQGWCEKDCIEWIEYNTLRALPYFDKAPIVMYPIEAGFA